MPTPYLSPWGVESPKKIKYASCLETKDGNSAESGGGTAPAKLLRVNVPYAEETIRAVHAGKKRIPPEAAAELAMHTAEDQLTERELEILKLIAQGNANKEIAAQLSIREDTVKSHVGNILEKLDANDRTHAVTIGLKRGIIEL